jgi:hypothetical protein
MAAQDIKLAHMKEYYFALHIASFSRKTWFLQTFGDVHLIAMPALVYRSIKRKLLL